MVKKSIAKKNGKRQAPPVIDIRLALYARVSSDDPPDTETIQAQLTCLRTWAAHYALPIVGEYRDAGLSGTVPLVSRPGGARLLADAQAGVYTLVLVTGFARLTDALTVLLEALKVFDHTGVRVRSAAEVAITPETPEGRAALCTHVSVLEYLRTQRQSAPLPPATLPPPVPLPLPRPQEDEAAREADRGQDTSRSAPMPRRHREPADSSRPRSVTWRKPGATFTLTYVDTMPYTAEVAGQTLRQFFLARRWARTPGDPSADQGPPPDRAAGAATPGDAGAGPGLAPAALGQDQAPTGEALEAPPRRQGRTGGKRPAAKG